jgi:frataxin
MLRLRTVLPSRRLSSLLTLNDYHHLSDHALEEIADRIDGIANDVTLSDGVVTIHTQHGTWVVNKQAPNLQIWLSSPISGPARFNYDIENKQWVHARDIKIKLRELLEQEMKEATGEDVELLVDQV